ncbi:uncharacterized protein LOC119552611 [Drosophila subpulchrella]|uniref:uncharacterized protein LOC119552611 n=1 Tax=Drosophila subpulchrella TaxID=1486046 RepID=UPI0018A1B592|nr:uncharacterized protein LOC119552611 [Drosophila subpulchrella]
MPVRLSSARSLNNKWIDCPPLHHPQQTQHPQHPRHALRPPRRPPSPTPPSPKLQLQPHSPLPVFQPVLLLVLLLILAPAPALCRDENCTFLEGYILQFVCHGTYVEEMRLQYKDRIPAIGTPYAIWKRSDTHDPSYLLISFYDSQLFNCYTVVMNSGKFYCDGRNYIEPNTEAARLHCINFPFHYTTHLYDACSKKPSTEGSPPISVAIAYMKDNIRRTDGTGPRLQCPAVVPLLVTTIPFLLSRYFGILLCQ